METVHGINRKILESRNENLVYSYDKRLNC